MPLVLMCGHPSSGKTTRSAMLAKHLSEAGSAVVVVNLDGLKIDKNVMFADPTAEKKGRASVMSAMERELSKSTIVIVDFINHIKGFRYEMYTRAKALGTQSCVIYCDVSVETARDWNSKREAADKYNDKVFEDLIGRLEVPNPKTRWDSPLFTIEEKADMPLADITAAILEGKAPAPSFATTPQQVEAPTFLYELNRITQEMTAAIQSAQAGAGGMHGAGDPIKLPHTTKTLTLSRTVTLVELRRVQRQYLKLAQMLPPSQQGVPEIAASFADYLTTALIA